MRVVFALWAVAVAAEESSLLQVEVDSSQESMFAIRNIGQQISALQIPGRANQLAINAMMKTLAKSNKLDADSAATLQNVSDLLKDPILLSLESEKISKDGELAEVDTEVASCNTNGVEDDGNKQTSANTARTDHSTCREEEFTAVINEETKCNEALGLMTATAAEVQCTYTPVVDGRPYPNAETIAAYLNKLNELDQQYTSKDTTVRPIIQECIDLTTTAASKMSECSQLQDQFETKFCEHRATRTALCSNRDECHTNATNAHDARWAAIGPLSTTRAKEACLIKHVICLIDNLLEHGTTDLDACDHVGLDPTECAAQYGNVEPPVPAKDGCDTDAVSVHPGAGGWYAAEYTEDPDDAAVDWSLSMAPADTVVHLDCA